VAKTTASMRGISPQFMKDLKGGVLSPLLELVKADPTLDLQIRDGYINIYYRGGSLLRVEEKKGVYVPFFDQEKQSGTKGYSAQLKALFKKTACPLPLPKPWTRDFADAVDVAEWMSSHLAVSKLMMDLSTSIKAERVVQQELVRVNNRSAVANGTDWFICDTEYVTPDQNEFGKKGSMRPDLVALHWASIGSERKRTQGLTWALMELKVGTKALGKAAGLDVHLKDMLKQTTNAAWLKNMREQILGSVRQKLELGVIPETALRKMPDGLSDQPPILVFILADLNPDAKEFPKWLRSLQGRPEAKRIRFFVASQMGYALFDDYLLTTDELERYLCKCWRQA